MPYHRFFGVKHSPQKPNNPIDNEEEQETEEGCCLALTTAEIADPAGPSVDGGKVKTRRDCDRYPERGFSPEDLSSREYQDDCGQHYNESGFLPLRLQVVTNWQCNVSEANQGYQRERPQHVAPGHLVFKRFDGFSTMLPRLALFVPPDKPLMFDAIRFSEVAPTQLGVQCSRSFRQ